MSYLVHRLTSTGDLILYEGSLDEISSSNIKISDTATTSAEFDEVSLNGALNGVVKKEYSNGNLSIAGTFNELEYENEEVYTVPGVYSWTCPSGISSVSVVCIGAGGAGAAPGPGGAGGGLRYINDLTVTPGTTYTVIVGAGGLAGNGNSPGGYSAFGSNIVFATGGESLTAGSLQTPLGGTGSTIGGNIGGADGGAGGAYRGAQGGGGGGGGAGGYSSNGGAGGAGGTFSPLTNGVSGQNSTNGGAGGSGGSGEYAGNPNGRGGGAGGGVGVFGLSGTTATGGNADAFGNGVGGLGGSAGTSGANYTGSQTAAGGLYGGGGGGGAIAGHGGPGANGAVRIMWSLRQLNRQFPSLNTKRILTNEIMNTALVSGVTGSYSLDWKTSLRHQVAVEFNSVEDIRNFFKLGGSIRIDAGASGGGIIGSKTSDWLTFLSAVQPVSYTASSFRRGGNLVVRSKTFVGGYYSANYIQAWGELVNDTTIVMTAIFDDASVQTGPGGSAFDEFVSGIAVTSTVDYLRPVGGITGPAPTLTTIYSLGP
jgi:hypothetical protein